MSQTAGLVHSYSQRSNCRDLGVSDPASVDSGETIAVIGVGIGEGVMNAEETKYAVMFLADGKRQGRRK